MKKILAVFISSILILLGASGIAFSAPMTWTDFIDFNPDILVPPTLKYTHDISDDGFSSPFMGGNDWIDSYELKVDIYDDNLGTKGYFLGFIPYNIPDGSEAAIIGTSGGIYSYDFALTSNTFEGNILGILDILMDGKINVTISSWCGDFMVASSTLAAHGDDGTAPVPEPATMFLLGTGLVGLAGFSRRKLKK